MVESEKNLLPNCWTFLVWIVYHIHDSSEQWILGSCSTISCISLWAFLALIVPRKVAFSRKHGVYLWTHQERKEGVSQSSHLCAIVVIANLLFILVQIRERAMLKICSSQKLFPFWLHTGFFWLSQLWNTKFFIYH